MPEPTYKELYRPQFHFSPSVGWIGDPCGLTYYDGKFHLFWWGKAESEDLVHYNEINRRAMQGGACGHGEEMKTEPLYSTDSVLPVVIFLRTSICTGISPRRESMWEMTPTMP